MPLRIPTLDFDMQSLRIWFVIQLAFAVVPIQDLAAQLPSVAQPNVILVMTDDMGYALLTSHAIHAEKHSF